MRQNGERPSPSTWTSTADPTCSDCPATSGKPDEVSLPSWARNEGRRFVAQSLSIKVETPDVDGLMAVDLVGDPLPDILMIRPGEAPALSMNKGNGQHWLTLQLGGHWQVRKVGMRTNSHAIGTRVFLEGQGIHVTYEHTTPESGLGQSIAPVVLGLGVRDKVDLVHIRWPDGVLQCELNVAGRSEAQP